MPDEVKIEDVEIWFQDETRIGQQGSISRTWHPKGQRPRLVRQQQFLSAYIFGAVCPEENKSSAVIYEVANYEVMQVHLDLIAKEIDKHAVVVMDKAGWHISKKLKIPKKISIMHLPSHAPELNPSENCWQLIKSRELKNRVFEDIDAIFRAATRAWNNFVSVKGQIKQTCSRQWANIRQFV